MEYALILALFCLSSTVGHAQIEETKIIDGGGSGPYSSFAVTEQTLPDFVIYRPANLRKAVRVEGKLPVLVWANGGCMDSSINYERMLAELASHGYIIVAIGSLQMTAAEREHRSTDDAALLDAIAWITTRAREKGTDYYKNVDLDKIAAGGQSCGGAQTMRIAGDDRVKTYLMLNAGMGDMTMAGASAGSLDSLNGQVVYIVGGDSDIATKNALMDYERISEVPVAFANMLDGGHMGTYAEEYGGAFAKMALDWLNWQLKGEDRSAVFLEGDLSDYPGWTVKSKNFE